MRVIMMILLAVLTVAAAAHAQLSGAGAGGDEYAELRQQITAVRTQLAQLQLELAQTLSRIAELKEYTAAQAPQQIAQWRQQREAIERQRQEVAQERAKLERARQAVRLAGRIEELPEAPLPPDPTAPRWDVDYKIATIPRDQGETIYVDPVIGDVLLQRFPQIDRGHIMVRGTFQNRSAVPYRYTFEIRLGDAFERIIGRWRYQTPPLWANELHQFEVRVPVEDVGLIRTYQIGNIEAERSNAQ